MKTFFLKGVFPLLTALLCFAPVAGQAQFNYVTNNGTITITSYTGPRGDVAIPDALNGLAVTAIGERAFWKRLVTSVTIPDSVTNIGERAFYQCRLISVTIGNSVTSIGFRAFSGCTSLTSITIPDSVTSIGQEAFSSCISLTTVTIGNGVTGIGGGAFSCCGSLTRIYFRGNAPSLRSSTFQEANIATVYYLPGNTGWGPTVGGRPTALWLPLIQPAPASFCGLTNEFGFGLSWARDQVLVVEACTDLANAMWSPLATNTLSDGDAYFSDPQWTDYPARFYRLSASNLEPAVLERLVWIPAGTFMMGSPESEPARYSEETQHEVTISRGFWMGKYEVTWAEYQAVMGSNPSYFQGVGLPVEMVNWNDAVAYCDALTAREAAAGRLPEGHAYRLPTEAQWEYACRAGTTTPFHYGDALRSGMANFDGRYEYPPCGGSEWSCYNSSGTYLGRTTSVGSYAPNAWGLYDMHGNVWEWCTDWYGAYGDGPVTDPPGPASGSRRVVRGGSWNESHSGPRGADVCRSATRGTSYSEVRRGYFGFRVALVAVP